MALPHLLRPTPLPCPPAPPSFEAIVARLNTEPGTTEGMDELEKYTAVVEGQLEEFGAKIEFAKQVGGGGSVCEGCVEGQPK